MNGNIQTENAILFVHSCCLLHEILREYYILHVEILFIGINK